MRLRSKPDLETYLTEAAILGATHLKFNIGTLGAGASSESVQNAVSKFDGTVTIENDQTPANGTLASTVGAAAAGNHQRWTSATGTGRKRIRKQRLQYSIRQ